MPDRNHHDNGQSIKRRIASHGELVPTAEFTETLLNQLQEKIRTSSTAVQPSRWQRYMRVRIPLATAASLLIVLGCLWAFFGNTHTATAGFGEMLRNIRQAETVTYTMSIQVIGEDTAIIQTYLNNTGQIRQEYSNGKTIIRDPLTKKRLVLSAPETRATFYRYDTHLPDASELLDTVKQLADSAGTFIRYETYQGRRTAVYEAPCEDGLMTIWVDTEEDLPVRLERRIPPVGNYGETIYTLDNFQWNLPIPPVTFAMEVPEGYRLEQPELDATEEDMIFLFRYLGEKNGVFPKDAQLGTIVEALIVRKDDIQTHHIAGGVFIASSDLKLKPCMRQCHKGIYFIKNRNKTGAFHYLGKGVTMGDSSAIVCYLDSLTF